MKKIKLAAIDLDGMLLSDKKEISPADMNAITKAKKKGVHIVFATGRHLDGAGTVIKAAGHTGCCITSAGAIITDKNDKLIYNKSIPAEKTNEIINFLREKELYFQVFPPLMPFLYERRCGYTDIYTKNCGIDGILTPDICERTDIESTKILVMNDHEPLLSLQNDIKEVFPGMPVVFSQPNYLEILPEGVSKGVALSFLTEALGLNKDETIAMGDSEVDISLVKAAGVGACPKNALKKVKENCSYISPRTNNESAVADILSTFILGG